MDAGRMDTLTALTLPSSCFILFSAMTPTDSNHRISRPDSRHLVLILLVALLVVILFYQAARPLGIENHVPLVNTDTLLYAQYARAWAQGHPYQFNASDPATTGCTSHVYPLLISLFHRLGFRDLALFDASYVLNILFFLSSIIVFWKIAARICPHYALPASLLLATSGPVLLGIFGLTETGLLLLVSLLFWHFHFHRRFIVMSIILFLFPFIRPEGVIVVMAYGMILGGQYLFRRFSTSPSSLPADSRILAVFLAGLTGVIALLLVNFFLTGSPVFDSVRNKSHFFNNHWLTALNQWIRTTINNFKDLLLPPSASIRTFYSIPILSGIAILLGIFTLSWKRIFSPSRILYLFWTLCVLGAVVMTSSSRTPVIHVDRYLVWILPLLFFFLIRGIDQLPFPPLFRHMLVVLFLFYQFATLPVFIHGYAASCADTRTKFMEMRKAHQTVGEETTVGILGGSGIKYFQPRWRVINLGGITSPFFRKSTELVESLKTMQHREDLQFQYYLIFSSRMKEFKPLLQPFISDTLVDRSMIPSNTPLFMARMSWKDRFLPLTPLTMPLDDPDLSKYTLSGHLDVGYPRDEQIHNFQTAYRYPYTDSFPHMTTVSVDQKDWMEVALAVLGSARFSFDTRPGREYLLVFRTLDRTSTPLGTLSGRRVIVTDTSRVPSLSLYIGDHYHRRVETRSSSTVKGDIREWRIPIPSSAIQSDTTSFLLKGDHIACDYWLYSRS